MPVGATDRKLRRHIWIFLFGLAVVSDQRLGTHGPGASGLSGISSSMALQEAVSAYIYIGYPTRLVTLCLRQTGQSSATLEC